MKRSEKGGKKRFKKPQAGRDPSLFTAATSLKVLKLCQDLMEKESSLTLPDAGRGGSDGRCGLIRRDFEYLVNLSAMENSLR